MEVVKEEMARVNADMLAVNEVKWTGMGEFDSDGHYIYYCGQESLRRNGIVIIVNKSHQYTYVNFKRNNFKKYGNPNVLLCNS